MQNGEKMTLNAEEARKISINNNERKEKVEQLIKEGTEKIKYACERGNRYTSISAGYIYGSTPQYQEVIEHFKKLGYNLKICYGTNLYEIQW